MQQYNAAGDNEEALRASSESGLLSNYTIALYTAPVNRGALLRTGGASQIIQQYNIN